jgi:CheY-like chemotaxis protein
VLLVDDDPVARRAAERLLRYLGYDPVPMSSGAEALAHLRQRPGSVRLALLDLSMPGMDGGETWRALRQLDPRLRGVLTSGYGKDGRVQAALGEGMLHFLPKPYGAKELASSLAAAVAAGDGVA